MFGKTSYLVLLRKRKWGKNHADYERAYPLRHITSHDVDTKQELKISSLLAMCRKAPNSSWRNLGWIMRN